MEELFNNILVLVPVALLIFLRVFAEGARKRSEKARMDAAAAPSGQAKNPQATRGPATTSATSGKSAWASRREQRQTAREQRKEKQEKPRPSTPARRDLLGRLRNYLSGTLEQLVEKPEPLHFEEEASRRLGQFGTRPAGSQSANPKLTPGYRAGLAGAMEESPAIVHEPAVPYAFPKRLERMTPLKRAIVLSEVLGKPKSLQQDSLQDSQP